MQECINLQGKHKFPKCTIKYIGKREDTVQYLVTAGCTGVHFAKVNSGGHGTSTSGGHGTSTSGDHGTSTSGDDGTSTSGDGGTSTSGDDGTSTSGYGGTSTSGYGGTSTSGYGGTSTSGNHGTSTSGDRGTIIIKYWDTKCERYRFCNWIYWRGRIGSECEVQVGCKSQVHESRIK